MFLNIFVFCDYVNVVFCLQATAEANNLSAVAEAKEVYVQLMDDVCGGAKPYLNTALMESEHRRVIDKALHHFNSKRKMGGEEFSETYRIQLEKVATPLTKSLKQS